MILRVAGFDSASGPIPGKGKHWLRARAAAGGARAEHGGGAPRERGSPGVGVGEAPEEARTGPGDTGQAEDRRAGLGVWERHGERATAVRADTRALYGFT